jgi:YVTN family beta-propeller protein
VDTSQSLLKQPADFPVISFTATPPILNDLDDSVTLSWACTDQGQQDVYSVYSDDWQPVDCINDGNCYTWQDGQNGVATPALGETTVFYLDVITTSSGQRTVVATLQTTVWLAVPSISTLSRLDQPYSGRQVTLRWLAYNAGSCSVAVNGVTVVPSAPVDTYRSGYPLTLEGPAGTYQVSVTANAVTGPASSTYTFPEVSVGPRISIPAGTSPSAVAVTKDGRQAVVVSAPSSTLTVVDVAARQPDPGVVSFEDVPWSVAVTPDGSLALVTHGYSDAWYVAVVDLKQVVLLQTISLAGTLGVLAVTPDGTLALVATGQSNSLGVIDIASRTAEAKAIPTGEFPYGVAITPDGTLALVTNWVGNSVTVIDVAKRAAEPSAIPVGRAPRGIAITPDGKLALVANWSNNTVGVIDIASRTAEPKEIAVGSQPDSLAISSDGRYALVPSAQDSTVTIVDVIARAAVSTVPGISVPGVGGPAVAMLPGGPNALVASMNQNSLALL